MRERHGLRFARLRGPALVLSERVAVAGEKRRIHAKVVARGRPCELLVSMHGNQQCGSSDIDVTWGPSLASGLPCSERARRCVARERDVGRAVAGLQADGFLSFGDELEVGD